MNVAIFTDNDFGKVNGVTTTLTAALDCAPPGMQLRVDTRPPRASTRWAANGQAPSSRSTGPIARPARRRSRIA
jgi:hypothetical protein